MNNSIKPKFLATGIGSMPFDDAEHAVDLSLGKLTQAPIWPQLPKLGFNEQMAPQYSQGMPNLVIDRDENRIYFDTSMDYSDAFVQFYEAYMKAMSPDTGDGNCSSMAISPEFSKGLYALKKRLETRKEKLPFIKVHTTGPCTFTLTIFDEKKQCIYYNPEFRDVIVKALAMKCRWQIQQFQPFAKKIICFIDEPVLSAYGSSTYISVMREDVISLLGEVIEAIHMDNALAGVHCCGNTEWSIPIDAGADIINFDAFEFGETIALYPDAVKSHLEKGRMLAWGIVPTSKAICEQTVESLAEHFEKMMNHLAAKGINKQLIIEQAMVTPSCGTGTMEPEDAEKVFEMTCELSKTMRKRYNINSY